MSWTRSHPISQGSLTGIECLCTPALRTPAWSRARQAQPLQPRHLQLQQSPLQQLPLLRNSHFYLGRLLACCRTARRHWKTPKMYPARLQSKIDIASQPISQMPLSSWGRRIKSDTVVTINKTPPKISTPPIQTVRTRPCRERLSDVDCPLAYTSQWHL